MCGLRSPTRSDALGLWCSLTLRDVCRDRCGGCLLPILLRRCAAEPPPPLRFVLLAVREIFCFFILLLPLLWLPPVLLSTGLTLVLCLRPRGGPSCGTDDPDGSSWLRYWLDEPECRFIECRLDADPEWRWCRLIELERRFSAKLFRLLLAVLARFVVLERMRLSVLSPPSAPP